MAHAQGRSAGAGSAGRHRPESVCPALSEPLPHRLTSSSHPMTRTDEAAATEATPTGDTQEGRVRTRPMHTQTCGGRGGSSWPAAEGWSARGSPETKVLGPGRQLFRPLPVRPAGTPGSGHNACWGRGELGAPQVLLASRRRVQDAPGPVVPRAGGWAPGTECKTASLLTQRSGHGFGGRRSLKGSPGAYDGSGMHGPQQIEGQGRPPATRGLGVTPRFPTAALRDRPLCVSHLGRG